MKRNWISVQTENDKLSVLMGLQGLAVRRYYPGVMSTRRLMQIMDALSEKYSMELGLVPTGINHAIIHLNCPR